MKLQWQQCTIARKHWEVQGILVELCGQQLHEQERGSVRYAGQHRCLAEGLEEGAREHAPPRELGGVAPLDWERDGRVAEACNPPRSHSVEADRRKLLVLDVRNTFQRIRYRSLPMVLASLETSEKDGKCRAVFQDVLVQPVLLK
eukprot:CAMPEP_0206222170 /NCGR_PEP_ID=MMETSP0047_2-20121206/5813_1 /ASSEMBLY_ACC=CAM_ASM_000192 /TAXON_ID=195065 /ORGANISM="Chroomonas mesostigmatica_cf, Strain CCMP1168" /LENGTH=144 /DNA_ID=CAMNT_0053644969 /DNA_START=23 /DNA_END=454 /DNA_ORIENTATION=-